MQGVLRTLEAMLKEQRVNARDSVESVSVVLWVLNTVFRLLSIISRLGERLVQVSPHSVRLQEMSGT